ncbi:MAG: Yip1 family protein, partial [Caldimonas sp.]
MPLIQRVQDILLRPRQTWPAIAAEPGDTASIYSSYVIYLAAIPAIAGFIGLSLVGAGAMGYSVRLPIATGLAHMVLGYVLSLVMVFVIALLVDALAPTFGGTKSQISALKLVAYGSTAGFVGGIFSLLPMLSILGLVAALYSIYLIYTGIPVLMKCPPEKAAAYTAVVIVCGIVAMLVLAAVTSMVLPSGPVRMAGGVAGAGDVTITTPSGTVAIDGSKVAEMSKKMEEAGRRMEAAQKSGDSAAAGKAMGEMMGAVTGASATPIAAQELKAMLPEALGDLKRES